MTVKFKSLKVVSGHSSCLTLKQQILEGLYFLSHLTLFDKLNCSVITVQLQMYLTNPVQLTHESSFIYALSLLFLIYSLHCQSTTCIS